MSERGRCNRLRELDRCGAGLPLATCKAATPDFSGDVVALANALAAKPLDGFVPDATGRRRVRVGAEEFLGLVFSADLSPGLDAELPAAVHAAREGVPQPLLRLDEIANDESSSEDDISFGLYLATSATTGRSRGSRAPR